MNNPYLGLFFLILGVIQTSTYFVLSIGYEITRPRLICRVCGAGLELGSSVCEHCGANSTQFWPSVTVITAAYNEEKVIQQCVETTLKSDYENLNLIVVNDGSTDSTKTILNSLSKTYSRMSVIHLDKRGGKAAALNKALESTTGSIIITADSDTYIDPRAIKKLVADLEWNQSIGAVCGYDTPANIVNWLVKILLLSAHVSTGFVRRALSYIGCLPVVNFGAFRRAVLDRVAEQRSKETGSPGQVFIENLGEDMELTIRIHKLGYKTVFEPDARALSESPSNLRTLWNQRTRWIRGFLQDIRLNKDLLFKSRFGWFMAYLLFSTTVLPVILLVSLIFFIIFDLILASSYDVWLAWNAIQFFGIFVVFFAVLWGLAIDQELRKNMRYLWVFPGWVFYSVFLTLVSVNALIIEMRRLPLTWDPWKKTGIISTVERARE